MHATAAQPPSGVTAQAVTSSVANQFVTFTCGNRAFGIEIMSVREIRSWTPTTELPGQPFGAKGVLDIRGRVVQVYDLASMLGSASYGEAAAGQVVLVVSLNEHDVGIVVDSVSDIIFARVEDMRPVPANGQRGGEMVSGLVKNDDRLIAILNLPALFPDHFQLD